MKINYISKRTDNFTKSWYAIVELDGVRLRVSRVRMGRPRRIAFSSGYGWHWLGEIREDATGKELWHGRVEKSTGVRGILKRWKDCASSEK